MKIYLVITESVFDYEKTCLYKAFRSEEQAHEEFQSVVLRTKEEAEHLGYEQDESSKYLTIYEEGYYTQNHIDVEIIEVELN